MFGASVSANVLFTNAKCAKDLGGPFVGANAYGASVNGQVEWGRSGGRDIVVGKVGAASGTEFGGGLAGYKERIARSSYRYSEARKWHPTGGREGRVFVKDPFGEVTVTRDRVVLRPRAGWIAPFSARNAREIEIRPDDVRPVRSRAFRLQPVVYFEPVDGGTPVRVNVKAWRRAALLQALREAGFSMVSSAS